MKILHTSDWHLGRSFGSVSLHDAQTQFCEWLGYEPKLGKMK